MDKKKILEIQGKIETAKSNISKLKGKQELYSKQLKDQFSCDSLPEAENYLKKLVSKIDRLEQSLEKALEDLQKKYKLIEDEQE